MPGAADIQVYVDQFLLWGARVVVAAAIFFIGRYLARWLSGLVVRAIRKFSADRAIASFAETLAYWLLLTVVILAALDQLGLSITSLLAVLAAAGLAVGLALKDSLSNVASGLLIIVLRPFTVGDYVTMAGHSGTVTEIGLFCTRLQTPDNRLITISNSDIFGGAIVNEYVYPTRRVDLVVSIAYEDDIAKARAIAEGILRGDPRVLSDPPPTVYVAELADSGINLNIRPWVKSGDYWPFYWEMLEAVKTAFDRGGITIPYPQREVRLRSNGGDGRG